MEANLLPGKNASSLEFLVGKEIVVGNERGGDDMRRVTVERIKGDKEALVDEIVFGLPIKPAIP